MSKKPNFKNWNKSKIFLFINNFNIKQKGFTLVELIITISIIAILSTISVISYSNYRAQARDAQRWSDISLLKTALDQYYSKNGAYPNTSEIITNEGSLYSALAPYLNKQYQDPQYNGDTTPAGYYYAYESSNADCNTANENIPVISINHFETTKYQTEYGHKDVRSLGAQYNINTADYNYCFNQ